MFSNKSYQIVFFLFIVGLLLRLWMINLDPFLHNWDEHFHALVAKNFSENFTFPVLIKNPIIEYKISNWNENHIWVHKQPFFLWQIALVIKTIGTSVFAVRLPSVIMTSISLLLIYRITFLVNKNYYTSFIALILATFSNYQLNLISGRIPTDHNDIAFGFYVLMSIWSYCEYLNSKKWYWIILTGIFSGISVLIKWLIGLLVFSSWGLISLNAIFRKNDYSLFKKLIIAFIFCLIVFLPWQIFIYYKYPVEFLFESAFNRRHFAEVLENHGGTIFYYLKNFRHFYGYITSLFVFAGIWFSYKKKYFNSEIGFSLIFYFLFLISFFSFLVATKMNAFVYSVLPIGLIFAAIGMECFIKNYCKKQFTLILFFIIVVIESINPFDIWKRTFMSDDFLRKTHNTKIYKKCDFIIPKEYNIILNLNDNENIDIMFYNKRSFTAYQGVFTKEQINVLLKKKVKIAAFVDHGPFILPDYIKSYPYIYIINEKLMD